MKLFLFLYLLLSSSLSGGSTTRTWADPTCSAYTFPGRTFKACVDLPVLSSYLHWTYNAAAATVDLAYRRTGVATPGQWVSWAINPSARGMVGAQCLVATVASDSTVTAYTSPVTSYSTGLSQGRLSFLVSRMEAVYADQEIILFATLDVPWNKTKVSHVWQDGPLSAGGVPLCHVTDGPNMRSSGTLDLVAGAHQGNGVEQEPPSNRLHRTRNNHRGDDHLIINNNSSRFSPPRVWILPLFVALISTMMNSFG